MLALLPALALVAAASVQAECADRDRFTFRVERVRPGPVEGIEVHVELGGGGLAADTVRAGLVRVCIAGGAPGEFVDVRLGEGKRAFRVLYPPNGRLPITHQGSPTIVVCEVKRDCDVLTMEEAGRLIQRAKPSATRLSAGDKEDLFRLWRDSLEAQGMQSGELVEALRRKERQVAASRAASELLSRFATRALEIVDRFRRHAPDALDHPSVGPLTQINAAVAAYNPVYEEMSEKADSYRKATADSWGEARSVQFQALVDEALDVHSRIYSLNELAGLITDCRHDWTTCPDKAAARSRILDGVGRIAVEVESRLQRFQRRKTAFLETLNEELFEVPSRAVPVLGGTVAQ
jgi:hypothetical protein